MYRIPYGILIGTVLEAQGRNLRGAVIPPCIGYIRYYLSTTLYYYYQMCGGDDNSLYGVVKTLKDQLMCEDVYAIDQDNPAWGYVYNHTTEFLDPRSGGNVTWEESLCFLML
jgi:hypothetical protein